MRIRSGLYKGDLAKVVDTEPSTQVGAARAARWACCACMLLMVFVLWTLLSLPASCVCVRVLSHLAHLPTLHINQTTTHICPSLFCPPASRPPAARHHQAGSPAGPGGDGCPQARGRPRQLWQAAQGQAPRAPLQPRRGGGPCDNVCRAAAVWRLAICAAATAGPYFAVQRTLAEECGIRPCV